MQNLEARLAQLERAEQRRRRVLAAAIPLVAGLTVVAAVAREPAADVIRAERFEVVGPNGGTVLTLGSDADGGLIQVLNNDGDPMLNIWVDDDGGALYVKDQSDSIVALLAADNERRGMLQLRDRGTTVVTVGGDADGGIIRLYDRTGTGASLLGVRQGGGGIMNLMNANGDINLIMGGSVEGSFLELKDRNLKPVASLSTDADGGLLLIRSRSETNAALVAVTESGDGFVQVYDKAGNASWRSQ
jgi:hypothetical protein